MEVASIWNRSRGPDDFVPDCCLEFAPLLMTALVVIQN